MCLSGSLREYACSFYSRSTTCAQRPFLDLLKEKYFYILYRKEEKKNNSFSHIYEEELYTFSFQCT